VYQNGASNRSQVQFQYNSSSAYLLLQSEGIIILHRVIVMVEHFSDLLFQIFPTFSSYKKSISFFRLKILILIGIPVILNFTEIPFSLTGVSF
jgi:hypothetical protein